RRVHWDVWRRPQAQCPCLGQSDHPPQERHLPVRNNRMRSPWYTDNMLQLPAMEADLFGALKDSALDVLEVRADAAGLSNIAYAKIRKQGAGDAKQALAVMLGSSKMAIPKV